MARRLASPEAKAEGGARSATGDQDARGKARRGEPAGRDGGSGCSGPTGPPRTATTRESPQATGATTASPPPLPLPLPAAKRHMDSRVPPEKVDRGAPRRQAGRRPPGGAWARRRDAQAGHKPPRRAPRPPRQVRRLLRRQPALAHSPSNRWPTSKRSSFCAGHRNARHDVQRLRGRGRRAARRDGEWNMDVLKNDRGALEHLVRHPQQPWGARPCLQVPLGFQWPGPPLRRRRCGGGAPEHTMHANYGNMRIRYSYILFIAGLSVGSQTGVARQGSAAAAIAVCIINCRLLGAGDRPAPGRQTGQF